MAASIILGLISKATKLGFWGGFLISLFLTPILGILIIISAKPKKHKANKRKN
jgi:hypothetical protein